MTLLICPKCGENLIRKEKQYQCINHHNYDLAKQGYLNLLLNQDKPSNQPGDAKAALIARKAFLNTGLYAPIIRQLIDLMGLYDPLTVLDIGCGEGYYLSNMKRSNPDIQAYGFDISKAAIQLACQYPESINWFVANATHIPLGDQSIDLAYNAFSFFKAEEVARVLKAAGIFILIRAQEFHLKELKELIYDTVTFKALESVELKSFNIINKIRKTETMTIQTHEQIMSLLKMTPHYYRMQKTKRSSLNHLDELKVTIDVEFVIFKKRCD